MTEFDSIYAKLNTKQKEVVDALYGSFMVVAGPGTGKTQVLAARTAKILSSTDILPENILITTFTEAGVIAIKKRLLNFIGSASYKVRVTTIHSLSKDIIESYPEYFLKYRALTLMDELENYELIEEILAAGEFPQLYNVNQPTYWIPEIVKRLKNLRDEAVTPEGFTEHMESLKDQFAEELSEINPERAKKTYANALERHAKILAQMKELQQIYREYNRIKGEKGKYDFSDMILYVAREISENDLLASQLSEQYQFVMVDEFQDLSNAQNSVINGLLRMSDAPNILTVGDDDQSIYRFQGANLENMLHFSQKFEDTKIIVLDENYRSGQEILDTARVLIENNTTRITKLIPSVSKPLRSATGKPSQVQIIASPNLESEQSQIVKRIKELQILGTPYSEMAILTRKNSEISLWTSLLETHGIPVTSRQKYNLFNTDEFKLIRYILDIVALAKVPDYSLIELLRIGIFPEDRIGLYRITRDLENLNYKRHQKMSVFDMLLATDTLETILPDSFAHWVTIGQTILELRSLPQTDIIGVIRTILSRLDIEKFIQSHSGIVGLSKVYKILTEIESLLLSGRVKTLKDVLDIWNRMEIYHITLEVPEVDSKTKGVQIMTAHQSKGLEYECVFVPGALNGVWGNTRNMERLVLPESITGGKLEKTEKNEEERRLFFVAVTRAKSRLEISFPASIRGIAKLPSEFLGEMGATMTEGLELEDYTIATEKDTGMFALTFESKDLTYLEEVLSKYKLSPTDLNTFLKDPSEFLKKSLLKYPFEDNPYFMFGRSYHESLENFFLKWKKDEKKPTLEFLIQTFTLSISRAYLTPAELVDAKKRGEEGLAGWYELQDVQMTLPAALEYSFSSRNILFDAIPLKGKVDRIDILPDGSLRVTDYKTGSRKSMNELTGKSASTDIGYYRQLMMYRLMLSLDPTWSKYSVSELCVDFVEGKNGEYDTVSLSIDIEQEAIFKDEIKTAWGQLSNPEWWVKYL